MMEGNSMVFNAEGNSMNNHLNVNNDSGEAKSEHSSGSGRKKDGLNKAAEKMKNFFKKKTK
jgi:hypothetical protein